MSQTHICNLLGKRLLFKLLRSKVGCFVQRLTVVVTKELNFKDSDGFTVERNQERLPPNQKWEEASKQHKPTADFAPNNACINNKWVGFELHIVLFTNNIPLNDSKSIS